MADNYKERPILFSGPMVRAILEGRKTMTRRIMKRQPPSWCDNLLNWFDDGIPKCPYGLPGDRLWVRETWGLKDNNLYYRADGEIHRIQWHPSIHMFRKYSRLTLEILNVRVERLQEIDAIDARHEGCEFHPGSRDKQQSMDEELLDQFKGLWESINGPGSWEKNPWVWVIEFKMVQGNAE